MKVVDARTGFTMDVSSTTPTCFAPDKRPTINYGDHKLVIYKITPGVFSWEMVGFSYWNENGQARGEEVVGRWPTRWMHPGFFLQHVAFIPS